MDIDIKATIGLPIVASSGAVEYVYVEEQVQRTFWERFFVLPPWKPKTKYRTVHNRVAKPTIIIMDNKVYCHPALVGLLMDFQKEVSK